MAFALVSRTKRPTPASVKPAYKTKPVHQFSGASPQYGPADMRASPTALARSSAIQAKLKIGQPNDKYEQEADRVADEVMRMPDSAVTGTAPPAVDRNDSDAHTKNGPPEIQRMCTECATEEENLQRTPLTHSPVLPNIAALNGPVEARCVFPKVQTLIQRDAKDSEEDILQAKRAANSSLAVHPGIEAGIASLRGGGQSLSPTERRFFEPRFGQDFSQVRIHVGRRASELTHSVNARAFTIGQDVVFGSTEYAPKTITGRRLLAHELTHVIQQSADSSAGNVQRQSDITEAPHNLPCELVENSNLGPSQDEAGPRAEILFFVEESFVTNDSEQLLENFVQEWKNEGGNGPVYIDAYASVDGPQSLNWSLSCERAREVESFLIGFGVDPDLITTFAHGASDSFSLEEHEPNRRAVVTAEPGHADPVEEDTSMEDPARPNCCLCTDSIDLRLQFFRSSLGYARAERTAWLNSLSKFSALKSDVYVKPDREVFKFAFASHGISTYEAGLLHDEYTPVRVDTVHDRYHRAIKDLQGLEARCNDCTGQNGDQCLQGSTLGKPKPLASTEEEKNKS